MSELPVSEPPAEAVERARRAWREAGFFVTGLRRRLDSLLPAHQVFTVGLQALADAAAIENVAEPVGWQFIVRRGGEPVAIEVSDRGDDVQLEEGPQVQGASAFFRSGLEEVDSRPESARMLRVPEMGLMAIWYSVPDLGHGVVVPLEPSPKQLRPLEEYDAADFLRRASDLARRRLEFYAPGSDEDIGG